MTHHQPDVCENVHTLDERIAHAWVHNRWFKVSRTVVGAGILLGAFAKLIYGREFNANDRWIGPLLGPLSFVWMMAFLHLFYVMVKIRLSRFTQIVCYVFYIGIGLVLGAFLVIDWLLKLGN
jgi:hypothetical protein